MERLPGFRDFYPEPLPHQALWSADARQYIFDKWRGTARRYGFREYDGPPLESLELFTTKSGEEIVGQLYNFIDKGERQVSLRPEMTPTLARMVAAYERGYKKPFKWFALPQLFRYERQQKGRLREHFRLSSRHAWQEFFRQRNNDARQEYAFYQIIDKLERDPAAQSEEKLRQAGFSLAEVSSFIEEGKPTAELESILNNLGARALQDYVKVDYHVIRGLAYYTGAVFEAFDRKGEFRAIAGGGRYDNLVKLISGGKVDLPALGFGMGDVVLLELLKARGLLPKFEASVDVFCLIEDESLRAESLRLIQDLRTAGSLVDYSLTPAKSDKQFKRAQELKALHTVKLERSEGGEPLVKVKNLKTRQETVVAISEAATVLRCSKS